MDAYTTGYWATREGRQNIEILGPPDESGTRLVLAQVLPTQYASTGKSGQQRANARVMAAAPRLLAVLKECEIALRTAMKIIGEAQQITNLDGASLPLQNAVNVIFEASGESCLNAPVDNNIGSRG